MGCARSKASFVDWEHICAQVVEEHKALYRASNNAPYDEKMQRLNSWMWGLFANIYDVERTKAEECYRRMRMVDKYDSKAQQHFKTALEQHLTAYKLPQIDVVCSGSFTNKMNIRNSDFDYNLVPNRKLSARETSVLATALEDYGLGYRSTNDTESKINIHIAFSGVRVYDGNHYNVDVRIRTFEFAPMQAEYQELRDMRDEYVLICITWAKKNLANSISYDMFKTLTYEWIQSQTKEFRFLLGNTIDDSCTIL